MSAIHRRQVGVALILLSLAAAVLRFLGLFGKRTDADGALLLLCLISLAGCLLFISSLPNTRSRK